MPEGWFYMAECAIINPLTYRGILAMLDQTLDGYIPNSKLHFYKQIFSRFEDREATLTTVESFCMEVIMHWANLRLRSSAT